MDRKELVKTLSTALNSPAKYLGVPSFAYEIKTENEIYHIDKFGCITTSKGVVTLEEILKGSHPEKDTSIDNYNIEIPLAGHTGRSLTNVLNMIYSKQQLIVKALELKELFVEDEFIKNLNTKKIETIEEFSDALNEIGAEGLKNIYVDFDKGTIAFKLTVENLSNEKISAFMELLVLIDSNSKQLKYASYKQSQEDNPKFALRTWLIRLGMVGDKYKEVRKILLKKLEGNSAFRKGSAK